MNSRRDFLSKASMLAAGASMMHIFPEAIQRAFAISPTAGSTYLDAEHVVFLMQENRSFDHMYGSLRGVRGFNDPRAIRLGNGNPVWLQSDKDRTYAPFRLNLKDTKATWMSSLPHAWADQVDAHNHGAHDGWLRAKRSGNDDYAHMPLTLGYYTREDLPFYYSLADAFTVCDHYFCSSLTGTTPNRLYFWSGTIKDPRDSEGNAMVWNSDADYDSPVSWKSFPERLTDAGVNWRAYQNEISVGVGLTPEEDSWLGNFTDNALEFFSAYNVKLSPKYIAYLPKEEQELKKRLSTIDDTIASAPAEKRAGMMKEREDIVERLARNATDQQLFTKEKFDALSGREKELHSRAFTCNEGDPRYHQLSKVKYKTGGKNREMDVPAGDVLFQFRKDVEEGNLPAVSWLVAPENFSDHPGAAWYGAWYLSEVFNILTRNPEVWKKTIFILNYDENDGYFDHMPPFLPPQEGKGKMSKGLNAASEFVSASRQSSSAEDMREGAAGLGFRVPMIVASPWTRGGYVNSQVFDHTSCIQFLEHFLSHKTKKQISETNISSWRRAVSGNLTSIFREAGITPADPSPVDKTEFLTEIHGAQFKKLPAGFKALTAQQQTRIREGKLNGLLPRQEKGTRPACALPYRTTADFTLTARGISLRLGLEAALQSSGTGGAAFTLRVSGGRVVRQYAVTATEKLNDEIVWSELSNEVFDLELFGSNGFYRRVSGPTQSAAVKVECREIVIPGAGQPGIEFRFPGDGEAGVAVKMRDLSYNNFGKHLDKVRLTNEREPHTFTWDLTASSGWYDIEIICGRHRYRYAGHVENGRESISDPAMA